MVAARDLLAKQLAAKGYGHRCLDLAIYRRELAGAEISTTVHERFLANDLLFNHRGLFGVTAYPVPKGDGGVRMFHFLELPLCLTYYALGFYVLELTNP